MIGERAGKQGAMSALKLRTIGGLAAALAAAAAPAKGEAHDFSSLVVMGPSGAAEVRVITDAPACPEIAIDGRPHPMRPRAPAGSLPLRATASDPKLSKAADFPVLTCEARLPKGARRVLVQGRRLPTPRPLVRRIVVIGDTGCRLNAGADAYQACNDPQAYPFRRLAERAAAWKPDLVVHVGDYEYREAPCEPSKADCAGSPWGYGWDAWQADFFGPAAPLLQAAPWVAVRGNHEDCARAGQGWMRFIDPRPLRAESDCSDPARDASADDQAPYAVPLGGGAQVVVLDMTTAATEPTPATDGRHAQFAADYVALARLAGKARYTFVAVHKPILGFAGELKKDQASLKPATRGIQSVFAEQNPQILPAGVGAVLSGHIHLWEQVGFSSNHPSQFIAGMSGTLEDVVPMPASLPAGATPTPGAVVESFSSWTRGFGYMTLERRRADAWDVTVWNLAGQVEKRCTLRGRRSRCESMAKTG
jgi:hypothetical protein